jgi:hypothetical protein
VRVLIFGLADAVAIVADCEVIDIRRSIPTTSMVGGMRLLLSAVVNDR